MTVRMASALDALKTAVWEANMLLPRYGLVTLTWGNASGVCRELGLMVIKPSGVPYGSLRSHDMVAVSLADGSVQAGTLKPSSDAQTHLELYRAFPGIGGVVHTHSRWATIFAQSGREIPAYGTTHADYFYGPVPCTRPMTQDEIAGGYERATGLVIAERFKSILPEEMPAVLVCNHGPFTWGCDALAAAENAAVLEEVAYMAWHNAVWNPDMPPMPQGLLDKHFLRKHGAGAYYGQT